MSAPFLHVDLARVPAALDGLVVDGSGALRLASVPADPEPAGPALAPAALAGPAGIAADPEGNLYIADTAGDRVVVVDCAGGERPLACLRGPGDAPGELREPRGLAVGPRGELYVADTGNHRIQVVDLRTGQLLAIWGQPDPYGPLEPSGEPGRFREPADVAVDAAGRVYVADRGNARVQRFSSRGDVDPAFADALAAAEDPPQEPTHVALGRVSPDGDERVLVLDVGASGATRLLVFDLDGTADDELTERWGEALADPSAVALVDGALYLGDASGRVVAFGADGAFLGVALGYAGPVAGLTLDADGRLVLHPGDGNPVRFGGTAPARAGTAVIGPISAPGTDEPTPWSRIRVEASVPAGGQLRLYTLTSDANVPPPALPQERDPAGPAATAVGAWRAAPAQAAEALVLNEPGRHLWIGLRLASGSPGPVVSGLRVEWDAAGWLRHLPAVYSTPPERGVFLRRALALLEAGLDDLTSPLHELPRLLDPATAPDAAERGRWLDWLGGWLGFELDARWDDARRRGAVARAFGLNGRRGTAGGLVALADLHFGRSISVRAPSGPVSPWALGSGEDRLGHDTVLAPAEPHGATLGTTARLDRSFLLGEDERGAPLYARAHHFCVHAYASDFPTDEARGELRRLVEREQPAHAASHVCFLEPAGRVGHQARVGVDAIVASEHVRLRLGRTGRLGEGAALPDDPHPAGAIVGEARLRRESPPTWEATE